MWLIRHPFIVVNAGKREFSIIMCEKIRVRLHILKITAVFAIEQRNNGKALGLCRMYTKLSVLKDPRVCFIGTQASESLKIDIGFCFIDTPDVFGTHNRFKKLLHTLSFKSNMYGTRWRRRSNGKRYSCVKKFLEKVGSPHNAFNIVRIYRLYIHKELFIQLFCR